VLFVSIIIERDTGRLLSGPEIVARGFVGADDDLIAEAAAEVRRALRRGASRGPAEYGRIVERTAQVLGGYIYRTTRQRPMILPVVTEM
jgi:ribonuclease J